MATQRQNRPMARAGTTRIPDPLQSAQANSRHLERIKARNKRITLLTVSLCLCLTVLACLAAGVFLLLREPADDGKILPNVIVGGVNIGGMTKEEAAAALRLGIGQSISKKSMVVELPGATLVLSAQDTKAALDLEAVVDAAYAHGRSGSAVEKNIARATAEKKDFVLALLPYMDLDLDYIRTAVVDFCDSYSIQITQPSVSVQGVRPEYVPPVIEEEDPDAPVDPEDPEVPEEPEIPVMPEEVEHQVMTITMGTPQFLLDSEDLYDAILDAYSLFQFTISYEAPDQVEPDRPDIAAIFQEYCLAPQDAILDADSFEITPEVVGYGFDMGYVQGLVDDAEYGQQVQVTLDFLYPDIFASDFGKMFQDVLGTYVSSSGGSYHYGRDINLALACKAIDGHVIKVGEKFDFDLVVGPRTTDRGYLSAPNYTGSTTSAIGGGISQIASALHCSALMAGLQIDEHHFHRYAVPYTTMGADAAVNYGAENLVFTNTTNAPIRVQASVIGSTVTITLLGTEERDYRVEVEADILSTSKPGTIYQSMSKDNVLGYVDGQVLQTALTGYQVQVFLARYDLETGQILQRQPLCIATYDKRDQVVVRIENMEEDEGL